MSKSSKRVNDSGLLLLSGSEIDSTQGQPPTMHKISLLQRSSEKHKPLAAAFLSENDGEDESTKKETTAAQGEVSPEDFIDLDEEVDGQVNDYGDDYDEEDESSPSP